jgi:hypothetical protein
MGNVGLEVVHVPGHRPEQINLLVYDGTRGEEPWFMLTADFVLVGDVARPDLAQGGDEGAPVLFDVSIPRFLICPTTWRFIPAIWPGPPEAASPVARLSLPWVMRDAITTPCASKAGAFCGLYAG